MRRWPAVSTLAAILGGLQGVATAQEGLGVVVRPPAEVRSGEVHEAPPIPFPTPPGPMAGATHGAEPGSIPRAAGRPPSIPAEPAPRRDRPAARVVADAIQVRPPLGARAPGDPAETIEAPIAPTIAPPIGTESIGSETLNPFLPPGPGRAIADTDGPERSGQSDRARGSGGSGPVVRERPGLFGRLFGRRADRPSPRPASRPEPAAPAFELDAEDPGAPEALKRRLEQMIIRREADRLASVELLIVGPRVHIRAEAARPWQRLALRRGLERLPMPPGFQSTVEVR
ncbi:hypothetical protein AB1L88_01315 [Tautonia sp. JC769]|uniref:hypothetical protein n=1 Tax=Tautonia sp. JC769 TaxID=3232135 RepID=UPI00345965F6